MQNRYRSITKYTDRLAAQFLELIARGHLVRAAANVAGVTVACIGLWRKNRPGFRLAFESAIEAGAVARAPSLPEGRCLKRWESMIAGATSQKVNPQSPNSPSPGV